MSKKKAAAPRKVGVIIANTGTPEAPTRKAVKKYLSQFLMDPRICPMPRPVWWTLLHTHILGKRSRASAEKYEKIWTEEGSPLIAITTSLESGLNEYYADRGLPVMVRAGMSYGKPQIKRVVKELKEAGCTELVVLPMYPQSAFSTTGSVSDGVEKAVRRARFKGDVCLIDGYGPSRGPRWSVWPRPPSRAAACSWCVPTSPWTAWKRSTTCPTSWSPSTGRYSRAWR